MFDKKDKKIDQIDIVMQTNKSIFSCFNFTAKCTEKDRVLPAGSEDAILNKSSKRKNKKCTGRKET